ncbi:uncharacterized protein FYW61_016181 [Anableps anableps]
MWTTSIVGSKMFLPILAVGILLIVSAGCSSPKAPGHVNLPCCNDGSGKVDGTIIECFEQRPRPSCQKHFYLVVVEGGLACIKPDSKWLKEKIQNKQLKCLLPGKY